MSPHHATEGAGKATNAGAGLAVVFVTSTAAAMPVQARRTAAERDRAEEATAFIVELLDDLGPVNPGGRGGAP